MTFPSEESAWLDAKGKEYDARATAKLEEINNALINANLPVRTVLAISTMVKEYGGIMTAGIIAPLMDGLISGMKPPKNDEGKPPWL